MFATKVWDKTGLVLAVGPPGSEKSVLSEHIIQEARLSGYSAKKMFHRLDRHRNWVETQVVSYLFFGQLCIYGNIRIFV